MAGPAVAVSGVRVGYGSFVVLQDVDLTVAGGEIIAVTGVNGAGKSTLLSCLAGLHRPTAGTVSVLGGPPRDDAAFWRAVALVADQPTWYPGLTLREHLELVRLTHEPVRGWCLPTDELIDVFGLPGRADAIPTDLSSGQRQRLSLAAALARPSRLLLLDEPEQSLDPGFRKQLAGLLREYAGDGGTVVMATHDLDFAAAAGARLVLLVLAQALGPLALSPADAAWLLLTPLDRRDVLRRPAAATAGIAVAAGGVLGVLALAMAGPFLRLPTGAGAHRVPWAWLVLSAVGGAGFFAAAMIAGVLAQPRPRWRVRLRAAGAVVGVAATVGAVAGERWHVVSRAVTGSFSGLNTGSFGLIAVAAVAAACATALLVRRMLPHFPAGVVRAGSARAGTVLLAAAFLNVPLLTWIAEDSHWRGRRLASRPWPRPTAFAPRLGPSFVLAWADWRRLGRRPAVLTALAVSALAPALAGAAFIGRAHGWVTAAVLLAGAIAAGTQGTAATRRDSNDPALRRLLGVDAGAALVARAVLPALLGTVWLALALALLAVTGELPGALWPLLGLAAGPGTAAAALRIARTAPINPADQGPDAPVTAPPWLLTRAGSVLLGLAAAWPTLRAVYAGHMHASTFGAQVAFAAVVLGGYLMIAVRSV